MSNSVRATMVNAEVMYWNEVKNGKAFHITERESLVANKKKIEAVEGGLYDKKIGSLIDTDAPIKDCACECQNLSGNFYEGQICPICNTQVVKSYLPNIEKFGWIDLEDHYVINPEAYELITSIITESKLHKIIKVNYEKSLTVEGNIIKNGKLTKSTQFDSIGLSQFRKRFEEIIMFFAERKGKIAEAQQLIKWKNRIFTSKILVYSSTLRPLLKSSKRNSADYDPINKAYAVIATSADILRRNKNRISDIAVPSILFTIQTTWVKLERMIIKTKISGKKKLTRGQILGGAFSWSSRMVVVPLLNEHYGMNNVVISYKAFLELYTFEIINILLNGYSGHTKFFNMSPFEIVNYIELAKYANEVDKDLYDVCKYLINHHEDGLWLIISRPPIMDIGSCEVLQIVDIIKSATTNCLMFPITSLESKNGDFDGDTFSCYSPKEKMIVDALREGISPKKLILDRTGYRLFDSKYGLYPEAGISLFNFVRNDDFAYEQGDEVNEEFMQIN